MVVFARTLREWLQLFFRPAPAARPPAGKRPRRPVPVWQVVVPGYTTGKGLVVRAWTKSEARAVAKRLLYVRRGRLPAAHVRKVA